MFPFPRSMKILDGKIASLVWVLLLLLLVGRSIDAFTIQTRANAPLGNGVVTSSCLTQSSLSWHSSRISVTRKLKKRRCRLTEERVWRKSWQLDFASSSSDPDAATSPAGDSEEIPIVKLIWRERWSKGFSKGPDDGVPLRQKLAKMGLSCVLSYGFVSNINAAITISLSWFVFAQKTGLSPLSPGQWKPFLAVYTGFYVVSNLVRPLRIAAALAISPQFDRAILALQNRLRVNKAIAITVTVLLVNLVGTSVVTCLGVSGAAALSGTPIFPPKA